MNERYFIIFFWGLRTKTITIENPPHIAQAGEVKNFTKEIETFFYSNMDCLTDGEYPNCEEITAEGKKLVEGCTELVITNMIELKSKQEFEEWKKKQPTTK